MENIINECISEAKKSLLHEDVPIGAVIVDKNNQIIAKAHNTRELENNILGHAEINVINLAAKITGSWNLSQYSMFITLKPCSMCLEVIKQAKIRNVYYLLDKLEEKKEFYKTKLIKLDLYYGKNIPFYEQLYLENLQNFFKKKR